MEGKKIVVLGGGTAGWMTALFCRKTFPLASITVIENTSLGTVGVGEGTTVGFTRFLYEIGLDEFDVMRESGGTIKSGISFENWNGDNKKYFHSFRGEDVFSLPPHFDGGCEKYYLQTLIKEGWQNRETGKKSDPRIQFNSFKLLHDVLDSFAKKLSIQLKLNEIDSNKLDRLNQIIDNFKGDHRLNFVVYDDEEKIKLDMISENKKVNISQELLDELDKEKIYFKLN